MPHLPILVVVMANPLYAVNIVPDGLAEIGCVHILLLTNTERERRRGRGREEEGGKEREERGVKRKGGGDEREGGRAGRRGRIWERDKQWSKQHDPVTLYKLPP